MIVSEPILPIRFYNNIFDQHRFNIHSNNSKQVDLCFPTNGLPSFQMRRTSTLAAPTKFILRNVCNDYGMVLSYGPDGPIWTPRNLYNVIPQSAANFGKVASELFYEDFTYTMGAVYDDGVNPPSGVADVPFCEITCRGLSNISNLDPFYTSSVANFKIPLQFPIGATSQKYSFKMIIDRFIRSVGSSFAIKIYNGTTSGTLIATITAAGIYNYDFTATFDFLTIEFYQLKGGDIFDIRYAQASIDTFDQKLDFDVELDEAQIQIAGMANGTDLFIYSDQSTLYNITPGEYYYIIVDGANRYFSEVFKVVPVSEIQKYYKLRWNSDCDINDAVIYNFERFPFAPFSFENVLYLDAALFKPEPETTEEGEENGEGEVTTLYKSWKKNINLEIAKCPEFIADSLSAMFIHDTIEITRPLNYMQETGLTTFTVEKVVPEVSNVLNDYFQKVNLKMLIYENFSKSGCCSLAKEFSCNPCTYNTASDCSTGYQFITTSPPAAGDGVKDCDTNELIVLNDDDVVCFNNFFYYFRKVSDIWQIYKKMPSIVQVTTVGSDQFVQGWVIPFSSALLQYKKNGGAWTTYSYVLAHSDGYYGILFPTSLMSGATDFKIRVKMNNVNCSLGTSDEEDLI